jgi:large conductance mechanosensitive channel
MLKEFRAFILRGNVVDLAVGIVIGAAFTALVTQFSASFINPLLAMPGGLERLGDYRFVISDTTFGYGAFLNAIITFVITGAVLFFFVVKPINALMERSKTGPDVESPTKECSECLSNIPAGARRCPFCTSSQ